MALKENTGIIDYIKLWFSKGKDWIKPDPADSPLLQILKLAMKSVVLLAMVALSPVILVVMLFVFFAAI